MQVSRLHKFSRPERGKKDEKSMKNREKEGKEKKKWAEKAEKVSENVLKSMKKARILGFGVRRKE